MCSHSCVFRFPKTDHAFLLRYLQFGAGSVSVEGSGVYTVHAKLKPSSSHSSGGIVDAANIWSPHPAHTRVPVSSLYFQRRLFTCAQLPFGLLSALQVVLAFEASSGSASITNFKDGSIIQSKHNPPECVVIHVASARAPTELAVIAYTSTSASMWEVFDHVVATTLQVVGRWWPGVVMEQWTPCPACIAVASLPSSVSMFHRSEWNPPGTDLIHKKCNKHRHDVVCGRFQGEFRIT